MLDDASAGRTALASVNGYRSSRSGEARVTAQLTSLEYESDRELAEVLGRLSRRFPDLSEWWLHELARSAYERFRDAHVRTFVPLLVERQVAAEVRRTSAVPSAAEGSLSRLTTSGGHGREAGHGRDGECQVRARSSWSDPALSGEGSSA